MWQTNEKQIIYYVNNWLQQEGKVNILLVPLVGVVWQSASARCKPINESDYLVTHPQIGQILSQYTTQYHIVYISNLDYRLVEKLFHTVKDLPLGPIIITHIRSLQILEDSYPININYQNSAQIVKDGQELIFDLNTIYLSQILTNYWVEIPSYPHCAILMGAPDTNKSKIVEKLVRSYGYQVLIVTNNSQRNEYLQLAEKYITSIPAQSVLIVGQNASYQDRSPFIALGKKLNRPTQIIWSVNPLQNNCNTYSNVELQFYQSRFQNPILTNDANVQLVYQS